MVVSHLSWLQQYVELPCTVIIIIIIIIITIIIINIIIIIIIIVNMKVDKS